MNLRYFGYSIRDKNQQNAFVYNIKGILDAYCNSTNNILKSSFIDNGENVYLIKIDEHKNLFYLIKTNNHDLIKQVNKVNFSVGDIQDKLSADERIGFASYIYFCDRSSIFALANSIGSPRFDNLCEFINALFSKVGLNDFEFEACALNKNAEKKDLLKMEVVNSIFIDVDANKGLGKLIKDYLFTRNQSGIGNFKITVESTSGNIKDAFTGMMNEFTDSSGNIDVIDDTGVQKIGAKAKLDSLRGNLLDYWLDNESCLSDVLNPKAKRKSINEQIEEKFDNNLFKDSYYEGFKIQKNIKVESNSFLDVYKKSAKFNLSDAANDGLHKGKSIQLVIKQSKLLESK